MFNNIIREACHHLYNSEVIAIPTETVYGLAADSTNDKAIASIYSIKNRPTFNPLIVHTANLSKALEYGHFSEDALKLAESFWKPGSSQHRPLTLIVNLPKNSKISKLSTTGLPTVGIRVPNHEITRELLETYPYPLSAPSANLSTQISATNVDIIQKTLGNKVPLIINGGPCQIGIESTIIDTSVTPFIILRYGGTTLEEISKILGYIPKIAKTGSLIKAPGMLKKHYAPSLKLRINQIQNKDGEVYLGFGSYDLSPYNLSKSGNLVEATANLFKMLYELDDPTQFSAINVAPIPLYGLGLAINDRLKRASASL